MRNKYIKAMTPVQKAKEMRDKFILKRSALLCCDEVIAEIEDLQQNCVMEFPLALGYWQSVKAEIEKL